MSDQFQVDVDQIRAHAGTVGDIAQQLSDVAGGLTGGLSGNALGSFVRFLTEGLSDAMNATTGAIATASSTMDRARAGLVRTADSYRNTDDTSASGLNGIEL